MRTVVGFAIALLVTIPGCGREGVRVMGVLQDKGQPLSLKESDQINLALEPLEKSTEPSAKANPGARVKWEDASFEFVGPADTLIMPGEYRVTLTIRSGESGDRFGGRFDSGKSPLTYTVGKDSPQHIIIDVGTKTVTRKP